MGFNIGAANIKKNKKILNVKSLYLNILLINTALRSFLPRN